MVSKRLTKVQKDEIIEAYRGGAHTNTLAEKYSCSSNTIIRTVKSLISDAEYKLLKEKRLKSSNKKVEPIKNQSFDNKKENYSEEPNFVNSSPPKVIEEEQSIKTDDYSYNSEFKEIDLLPIDDSSTFELQNYENSNIEKINQHPDNKFEEILPLTTSFDFEKKELDFEILNQEILPDSVYMLVDKKVELEVKVISDLPEWGFLPDHELKRNAIVLFLNQRTAKRSCSRNQRVIKIPNTNVFELSKPYLLSKGITRLILENSIIALDN
tara:strand:+ start:185 stop:988 length:804 start_codon:yes stop_codon:yes gene_type:complete